jgi:hypothetical protein
MPAVLLFAAIGPLLAQEADEVKDGAKFFKPETVRQANEAVHALAKKGIRLAIETYPTVPPGLEKVKDLDAKGREEAFQEWSLKRVKALGENSVYILLTNDPKHLEFRYGPEAAKKGLTTEKSHEIIKGMLEKLRKNHIDEALLDATGTVRKLFDAPGDGK